MSIDGFSLEITSAVTLPEIGPRLRPIIEWPVATDKFEYFLVRPIYGMPSGEQGRSPRHGLMPSKSSDLNSG